MSSTTNPTSGSPYALIGTTLMATDPVSNRVQATFAGTDPFTSAQIGINSMVLQFGSLPSTERQRLRTLRIFIDNFIYAAARIPGHPVVDQRSEPTDIHDRGKPHNKRARRTTAGLKPSEPHAVIGDGYGARPQRQ